MDDTTLVGLNSKQIAIFHHVHSSFLHHTAMLREDCGYVEKDRRIVEHLAIAIPVIDAPVPEQARHTIDFLNDMTLVMMSWADRNTLWDHGPDTVRGHMVERILISGNVWERPLPELSWLGENYLKIAPFADSLIALKTANRSFIEPLIKDAIPQVASGFL